MAATTPVPPGEPGDVRVRHGLAALVEATDRHPFVRWELTDELARTWWQVDGAVGFRRVRPTGRRSFTLLGSDAGVARLVEHLDEIAARVADSESPPSPASPTSPASPASSASPTSPAREPFGVSVPQHLEPLLHERFRVGQGGDWEWFHTDRAPAADPAHHLVHPVDDVGRHREITAFLAQHSPTADTPPGAGERWFAIDAADGSLAAVAAWGTTLGGAPHLSSVAVDTTLRGRGLGRAVVGAVTRLAVHEAGVCTLGMYSHNAVGRALYLSLGYEDVCAWASRAVLLPRAA